MSIQSDVDRGLHLVAFIDTAKAELKEIERRLEAHALTGPQVPLEDPDREGRQYLAKGTHATVPVVFESDMIAGTFAADSVQHTSLLEVGVDLAPFFIDKRSFANAIRSGLKFRKAAFEQFGPEKGAEFIAASIVRDKHGIPRSRTVISWDRAS